MINNIHILLRFQKASFLTALMLVLLSCHSNVKKNLEEDKYNYSSSFDTSAFIKQLQLSESCSKLEFLNVLGDTVLQDQVDTLVLKYISYACHCPNWVDAEEYDRVENKNLFNQIKYSYYLEPAFKECELNDRFCCDGNLIRFIGKEHVEILNSKNTEIKSDSYSPGRFFRYYSYEIIKPYKIWGPEICDSGDVDLNGKQNTYSVQLEVN